MNRTSRIDRRQLFAGTAAFGAAAALGQGPARAAVPQQGAQVPGIYRFMVGALEVTTIRDGAIQIPGPHPIFGENVEADAVATLAAENFLPADKMEIPFTTTVVNTGSQVILFDTGNGAGRRPSAGHTRAALAGAGIAPENVDLVVLTHFHGDHIGGMLEDGAPAYPNAAYMAGAAEYDFWSDEDLLLDDTMQARAQLVHSNVVRFAEKMTMLAPGDSVAPGIEAVGSFGHTPGHMAYHLESNGERLMLIGDVCNHYVISLQRPDWHVRFDMDKDNAVTARKQVLGMIAADRIPFVGYHMPSPAVGYLEPKGEGFRFVAAGYQLNL